MTTDNDILTQMQYALIETPDGGLTVDSGLWVVQEFIDAINIAQQWVICEARPLFSRTTLVTVPNQLRHPLPQDWLVTRRVSWTRADGTVSELVRDSSWSADYLDQTWSFDAALTAPAAYTDFDPPSLQIQVMPPSQDAGVIGLTYVAEPVTLSNTGVAWTLPDPLIPMAKWYAIAILLAKDGRGQDLPRAQIAQQHAQEGMTALKILLTGWL